MHALRDHLLASPAFAEDQQRCVRFRIALNERANPLHGRTFADQIIEPVTRSELAGPLRRAQRAVEPLDGTRFLERQNCAGRRTMCRERAAMHDIAHTAYWAERGSGGG